MCFVGGRGRRFALLTDEGPRITAEREAVSIILYDTTLRDGTQREGISLSVGDKLRIARELDTLGVGYIEGGWPG